jgi:hypothetical protein
MTAEATAIGTPRFFGTDGFKGMSLSVSDDDRDAKQGARVVELKLPPTFLQRALELRIGYFKHLVRDEITERICLVKSKFYFLAAF